MSIGKKNPWRVIAGAAIAISIAAIAGQSILASLNATAGNTVAQNVNSGTLKLELANAGNGFSTTIANLAPGDIVNRYVTLTNSGSLDGVGLTLQATASGTSTATLLNDGVAPSTTKALRVTVTSCPTVWTIISGGCASPTVEIDNVTLGSLSTAKPLSNSAMISGAVRYLQIKVALPDQNETTVNGVLPANTVQGGSVDVNYKFDLAQRIATTTNS